MPEGTASESAGRGILSWITMALSAVLFVYLLGFAVLVLFPPTVKVMGLSENTLEKVYYPILWFLR